MDQKTKSIIEVFFIILIFIVLSYIVQTNLEYFKDIIGDGFVGMFFYVLITIIAVVVAPVTAMPFLLPIAANLWNWVFVAILSIIAWTIGAIIAFILARIYGVRIVKKFVSIDKITKFEKMIPKKNIFWSVVFLRMVIPVDILSYALGIFSKISIRSYLLATLIGVAPFAFILSYLGQMPFYYQIVAFLIAIIIIISGVIIKKIRDRK
ncbi:hypothetical protein CMI39_00220 [Candidatus Pacearchaeota archaeon]|mgnify:CR=1 FL=1|jgi:uncharacterized membrane protein YdjX (TVP38/TMEM64 family)|nr:hypothetical protein [Candidatus Pacearchaeota archaeon]|tara:strand:+ start:4164 stop:4787 length:624 start_codon:yes stop_codon:yes gene_type:complete